jgi:hypothetical protein
MNHIEEDINNEVNKKIYQFENISWIDINNYSESTPLKERPIILVDLKDTLNRKYNAVVVNTYINYDYLYMFDILIILSIKSTIGGLVIKIERLV